MELDNEFEHDLKKLRHKREMTIRELADRAGVSYGHLGQWENGKEMMSRETAKKLADALRVDWRELFSCQQNQAARFQFKDIQSMYKQGKLNDHELETNLYKLLWTISDRRLDYDKVSSQIKSCYEDTIQQIHDFLAQS